MSQIFHSVSITIYFCRSEPCNILLHICFSLKVEDFGHCPFCGCSSGRRGVRRSGELKRNLQGACKRAAGNPKNQTLKKTIVPHSGPALDVSMEFEH